MRRLQHAPDERAPQLAFSTQAGVSGQERRPSDQVGQIGDAASGASASSEKSANSNPGPTVHPTNV